jgi:hypothetical protein
VGRAYNQNGRTSYTKGSPAKTIHSKRRLGKPKKRWADGVREDAVALHELGKQKPKIRESWRQRTEEADARFGL